jgi:nucleotide-binding universal stress UspA family protein
VFAWLDRKVEEFTAPIKGELGKIRFKTKILESVRPPDAISAHLRSNNFDLVILGTSGQESFFGLRFGSTAERLVHDTHCSALTVKPMGG